MTQEEHWRGLLPSRCDAFLIPAAMGVTPAQLWRTASYPRWPGAFRSLLAVVEHRHAEDRVATPRPTLTVAPAAPVRAVHALQDDDTGTATISLRFDTQMLARVDAAAKRLGISRAAWLHLAAEGLLEDRR
jgi:hypothetical protein